MALRRSSNPLPSPPGPPWTSPLPPANTGAVPEWSITFADMMSLLLVFFIMLVSYSSMDLVKYRAMVTSMKQGFGVRHEAAMAVPSAGDAGSGEAGSGQAGPGQAAEERDSREVVESLEAMARASGPGGPIELYHTPDGVRLRVEGRILFPFGRSDLKPDAEALILRLAPLFARYPYRIWIEGHTDDVPIQNEVYPSNWELSAARAGSVVRGLIHSGGVPAGRLVAVGYAETRPVASNADEAGRARNRRVEFLLSKSPLPVP